MFSSLIGRKYAGRLLFGAYIRLLLNRGEVLVLNMEDLRAFPLDGTWRRQQSNQRSNPVNIRRKIVDQTWPFCCLLIKSSKKIISRTYTEKQTNPGKNEKSRGKQ